LTSPLPRLTAALSDRYRLESELGEGGMATVYLAQDIKHNRRVAVKVLRPELAAVIGAERFLTEITTTANLQHPHILPLFDSGEADSFLFYVMPYVEGETVRDRISREKQLPVADAVRIASEVAAALDYAHRHGVIHRDIKPENILLHDGSALVADFGIALAASKAGGTRMTETGMSLGTPHYMSPEQAMGEREITARSDVYAVGCVLYEMLTGDPPFTGSTAQAIVARVVTEHPRSMTSQRHTIPPQVEAAVLTALEKLPADRFATAAEFAAALADPGYASKTTVMMAAATGRGRFSRFAAPLAVIAAIATIAALWGWLRPVPPRATLRYTMVLPVGKELTSDRGTRFAISPDGSKIVYAGQGPEGTQLHLLDRRQLEPVSLPGTDGAIVPFFSPDGEQVGFMLLGNGAIKVMPLSGAPPVTIADSGLGADGATWSADGYIYFDGLTGGGTTGLIRVPAAGGALEQMTTVDTANGEQDHFWPVAIPGGRGVLFTVQYRSARQASNIAVFDQKSGTYRTLVQGLTARYAPTGHLLYVSPAGDLLAVKFDLKRLQVDGQPVALTNKIAGRAFGAVDLALSASGTLIYQVGEVNTDPAAVVYMTRDGRATPVDSGWSSGFQTLALSPDGRQLAVSIVANGEQQVWIKQLPDGPLSKLTFDGQQNIRPTWHPDGQTVGFTSATLTFADVRADGSAQPRALVTDTVRSGVQEAAWSKDGMWIVYRTTTRDILARRTAGDTAVVPLLLTSTFQEIEPTLSPDGKWLAYASNESGRFEIYVRPFPDTDRAKWQVSTDGGTDPLWSRSGRELFFIANTGMVTSVEVLPGTTFTMGRRTPLFSASQTAGGPHSWDITPDDQRFVRIQLAGTGETQNRELVVVENFFPELESKKQP
jgi:Tol biopolymer transport system component/tRNA A-37 threonylcarbamoyl transferase component Bud32